MLSLFPQLLDWGFYVPFFFRLFIGVYLMALGVQVGKSRKIEVSEQNQDAILYLGILLFLAGIFFIGGLFLQALGSVGFTLSVLALYAKHKKSTLTDESVTFYLLFGLVSISLILLGPGPFSVDLPL